MYFKTKELVTLALFGTMAFVVGYILGTALLAATGVPMTGGLLNMVAAVFLLVTGVKIVNKFGAVIIMTTILGTLSIPTLVNGTPGVYKVFLLFLLGLIIDITIYLFKKSNKGIYLGSAIGAFLLPFFMYWTFIFLGMPAAEKLQPLLIPFMFIYAILALIGAWLGVKFYDKKLKNKAFVKQLQG